MRQRRSIFARGFTLIELVFVLVIIAVIAAMVVPKMDRFARGQGVSDSADQVIALARWARTHAITRGVSFRLNFDPGKGTYWLTMQNGASFENMQPNSSSQTGTLGLSAGGAQSTTTFADVGEEPGRVFMAPGGVSFDSTIVQQPDGLYVEFYPSGRCDPGTIVFHDSGGAQIEIGCLAGTEQYHVLTEDEKQLEQSMTPAPPGQSF
ncbi:MAG TPA: GspH/FimT family pseudopilin [Tepidisphaeraceae bacterium]|jgi:prepilin-type N-terminal cleavage/methylation domain-containing protein|nr:GspH/FimT family pseudopilin [Tepidisphaeraceae bacterium]